MLVKKREIVLAIVLSIVTCGLYSIYWFVNLVDDVNIVTRKRDAYSGVIVFLLSVVTCGIYTIYWYYQAGNAVDERRRGVGLDSGNRGLIYLLCSIFGLSIISMALLQNDVNESVDSNWDGFNTATAYKREAEIDFTGAEERRNSDEL